MRSPIKATVLLRGPSLLLEPLLKVSLGTVRREDPPGRLKGLASGLECRRGAASALARPAARKEAAAPLPFESRTRIADALRDRTGVDVAVIDAPALLREATIAAAGGGEMPHDSADRGGGEAARIVNAQGASS